MAKKRAAPDQVPPNPKRTKASKTSAAGKRATPSSSKVSERPNSSPGKSLVEPSSASDHLTPIVSFLHEHLPAEKVQAVLDSEPLERLTQVTDSVVSVCFYIYLVGISFLSLYYFLLFFGANLLITAELCWWFLKQILPYLLLDCTAQSRLRILFRLLLHLHTFLKLGNLPVCMWILQWSQLVLVL